MKYLRNITRCLLATFLVASGGAAANAQAVERLQKAGTVNIGTTQEPPYAIISPDGTPSGAALDLNKVVFEKLGVKAIKVESIDFAGLIPGIQAKRFDAVSTGLMIRGPRCKAVLFSEPDLCTAEGFAVKKGNPLGLNTYADLVKGATRTAVCGSCVEERRALEVGVPRDRLVIAADAFNAIKMLQAGRVDAVAWPDATLKSIIATLNDEGLEVVSPVQGEPISCSGVAFNRADRDLRDAYDVAFAELKASGEFAKIVAPYGFDPDLVLAETRATHCGGEEN
ncbi:ectoine/hydroxyectoine ABC transporter substrate-binding protein EhuB [Pseudochelatococcus sp. B33]